MQEDKNVVGVLDNLNTPSVTEENPLFSLNNFFKPTSRNIQIAGTVIKSVCASIVMFAATLLVSNPTLAIGLTIGAVIIGGLGEALQLFTKEEPVSTILRAKEDLNIEQAQQGNDTI